MCRSKANGGRRCTGRTTATTTTGGTAVPTSTATKNTTTNAAATSGASGGVPTREHTDKLAAALPADRTGWDGRPLDDKGRRLFALRESGYRGPIDQDGYPDTTSEGAGILRRMAERRGEHVDW
jgi:hypothetical protein